MLLTSIPFYILYYTSLPIRFFSSKKTGLRLWEGDHPHNPDDNEDLNAALCDEFGLSRYPDIRIPGQDPSTSSFEPDQVHGLWLGLSMLYLIMSILENLHPIPEGLTKSLRRPTAHLAIFEKLPSDVMNNILVQLDVKSFRDSRNANAKAHTSTRGQCALFTAQALVYQYDIPRTEVNIIIYIPLQQKAVREGYIAGLVLHLMLLRSETPPEGQCHESDENNLDHTFKKIVCTEVKRYMGRCGRHLATLFHG
ncbi:hypothetical protein H9Q74_006607 [Fusarium xylarioides]|nr:hypothetical protein H9Q71_008120 [Fusarium xylarioides]KAG5823288.1 hypothetical protein H9Q74_006607 [Fusarium xylarioides]